MKRASDVSPPQRTSTKRKKDFRMATPDSTPLKRCSKCGVEYPATNEHFRNSNQSKDGLFAYCRECCRVIDRQRNRTEERQRTAQKKALTEQGLATCSVCGETKPLTHFYAGSKKQSGVKSWCKTCYSLRMGWEHQPRKQFPPAPEGYKYCRKCDALKPLSAFYDIDTQHNRDGKNSYCADCVIKEAEYQRVAKGVKLREKYPIGYKRCSMCRRILPKNEAFFAKRKTGFQGVCKQCFRDYRKRPDIIASRRTQQVLSVNRRRARKRALPADLTEQQWKECLAYWDNRCAVCGNTADLWRFLAQDHYIPVKHGGGTTATNIIPLCHSRKGDPTGIASCNVSKGSKDPVEWLENRYGKRKAKEITDRVNAYFDWVKQQP